MNRDDLDGWFARADDVLTDWHGSDDAMDSTNPDLIPEPGTTWLTELLMDNLARASRHAGDAGLDRDTTSN